jgi:hypothetical protein
MAYNVYLLYANYCGKTPLSPAAWDVLTNDIKILVLDCLEIKSAALKVAGDIKTV